MQQAIIACEVLQPNVSGACREIEPEALACLVGRSVTQKELAPRIAARCAGRRRRKSSRQRGRSRAECRRTRLDVPQVPRFTRSVCVALKAKHALASRSAQSSSATGRSRPVDRELNGSTCVKRSAVILTIGVAALLFSSVALALEGEASGIAAAQNGKEVKIQAQRVINEKVIVRLTGGGKIIELTLSYPVIFADLDITRSAGGPPSLKNECKMPPAQRARKSDPNTRAQRRKAAAKAMGEVRKLVAAAR